MNEKINQIREIINEAEAMRGAYFYTPPGNAGGRRWYERQHTHARVEWIEGGHTYAAAFSTVCSCRNVYARGTYERDGKRTTLPAIRNSLRRLEGVNANA